MGISTTKKTRISTPKNCSLIILRVFKDRQSAADASLALFRFSPFRWMNG